MINKAEISAKLSEYIKIKKYPLIYNILVYRNGEMVLEEYFGKSKVDDRHHIKSISKSIVSILAGICLDQGIIKSLEDPIGMYIPEFKDSDQPFHQMITIRTLLTMTSGIYWNGGVHYHCPMVEQLDRSDNIPAHLADIQVKDFPGTRYQYKEWDMLLLSMVLGNAVQKAYGSKMQLYDFCHEFLYKPLEITSDRWWERQGFSYPLGMKNIDQSPSNLSGRDLIKIGSLFLNRGEFEGNRIVSESYMKEATSPSSQNPEYGLFWWLYDWGYGCRGYGGQEINIVPSDDMVYVIQAEATSRPKVYGDVFDLVREMLV